MSERNMRKQRGLSIVGMIFIGGIVAMLAVLAIKVLPDVLEYMAIVKVSKAVAMDPATQSASVADIRRNFQKRGSIDNISSITPADLDISKEGNDVVIAFAYTKKIPLSGPVSLTIDFEGSSAK